MIPIEKKEESKDKSCSEALKTINNDKVCSDLPTIDKSHVRKEDGEVNLNFNSRFTATCVNKIIQCEDLYKARERIRQS